uniref:Tenellin synthetase n=1 Tax=Beauveria bassiana TaxID=176275 RepID=TENS_BEABA|nr:RecName: Full=Tenellin synthetase; Short=TENS; AltName: Full=Hybrid PKS-NRPS synthetase tenS; AltName: Full=Tenellin-type 2-pyridones biosynthesis cluster protein S [Beauveria bassiana]CAL69597.1 nonribosomal peptide synthase [Beauveria bassiana]
MSPMKQNESESHSVSEPIAIIGSAYRFPGGCNTPSKLWDLLRQPRDILKEIDPERLNLRRYYHPDGETHGSTDVANKAYTLEEDISRFDASFFGISPLEAASMDPQQRTLLEVVYESTETAGIPLDKLRGSLTSVHVGVMTTDWAQMQRRDPETMPQYTATGIASSIISNRISYIFDLKGASETIDTACSSSLVALHNAARALQSGDCEKAIVAGVNLILDPDPFIYESKLHMLSPDARSRMWDAAANGYARGEGAAAVVLKTLGHALRDGDRIEGVIRSTFVNSDGLSSGLTMPSSAAQTALIRQTYRKAGLDPVRDRPQFFECHGTGTKAGDPVEARAISDAFLPPSHRTNGAATTVDAPLYVGSIKTVVGHLEGCAGLAGLVKVLLSLKHGIIPPNLWFDKLNPEIARYYGPLQIPTKAIPWPKLAPGTPLRASVNSFGFGGTNAHAIIERYDASQSYCSQWRRNMTEEKTIARTQNNESIEIPVPLVLTAKTGRALWRTVDAYAQHLRQHPKLRVTNLSQFMHSRRSTHRVRASFSGASREELVENMAKFVQAHAADAKSPASQNRIGYSPLHIDPKEAPGILGVFTGQGAQWPAMGRDMMHQSPLFRKTIADCESVLQALPAKDAPVWSLSEELKKDASTSRLGEAEISQPLCTAVQLALVNVLLASGVHFDAVVGHSSGEIAATYASGIINLEAAMQIAYYRGLYAKLARGETDAAGGMMAAGLSMNDAVKLCRLPEFEGRIHVAASNAPQSVTLSGDKEAIKAAKAKLDADGVFARELKVDTAYHSHHMLPCAEPYLKALLACDIQVSAPTTTPGRKCMWSSSVRGDAELLRHDRNLDSLKGPYWVANMVQTVLFSRAVQSTIWHGGPFDLAVEVGPHPALKGPTEQTLKAVYGSAPLYTGVLSRGANDAVAFSTAIGNIWSHLGPAFVDITGYQSIFSSTCEGHGGGSAAPFISDLPLYPWDHDEEYWRESRISRRHRTGKDESHELLGRRTPDDNEREIRWRNLLKVSELPWTQGHRVLGEVLLPGAAYISMAIEAGRRLALDQGREARLLEVSDVDILRPVVVADNKEGTETLFTVRLLDEYASTGKKSDELITASFSFYIYNSPASTSIVHTCEGRIAVQLGAKLGSEAGANSMPQLPHREPSISNLQQLDCEKLYSVFETIGLEYSGAFRRIVSSSRCLGHATATASWPTTDLNDCYLIHPAILDVAFQTIFVARAHPDSGQLSSALLPSRIERVRVVPSLAMGSKLQNNENFNAAIDSWALNQTASSLTGNINVYDAESGRALIQVEGFEVRAVGEPDASKDRLLFYETVWGRDISIMGLSDPIRDETSDAMVHNLSEAIERVSLFYVRQLMGELSTADRRQANWYHTRMLAAFDYHLAKVHEETHLHLRPEWLADDWAVIQTIDEAYPDAVELQMLHAVGQNVADVIRGKKHLLEVLRVDNLLDRLYTEDKGMHMANLFLANALEEITFKFPRCKILEIGAGTGATTWAALSAIGEAFDTYTYTDLSVGFFENAVERFSAFRHRMVFRALDIEKDPASQSFDLNSYDIIIATNVLHATRNLGVTLGNVRALLKPGGYLLLNEKTGPESLRATFNFGGLEGWWLAEEKERQLSPLMSPDGWDAQLQKASFSGVDHIVHDVQEDQQDKQQNSMIMSQAVDDTFYARLSPLSEMANLLPMNEPLLIIGGQTTATLKMIKEIQKLLPRQWRHKVRLIASVDHVEAEGLPAHSDVICLQELDRGLFTTAMTSKCLDALKTLFINTRNLLWVTNAQNSSSMTPRASMFRGITRVLDGEVPHIRTQVLGIEPRETPSATARTLLEAFLRLRSDDGRHAGNVDEDGADGSSQQVLWLHEPEAELLSNGTMMVPRVKARKSLNDTYLASTRAISTTVDARCVSVQAVAGPAKMLLRPVEDFAGEHAISNQTSDSKVHIQVESTLHIPEALDGTCLYLVCGWTRTAETSVPVIALSANNASMVAVESKAVAMIDEVDVKPETLLRVFQHMAMQALDSAVKRHGQGQSTALIYGADEELAKLTSERFAVRESKVYFASSRTFAPGDWLKVQPLLSKFALSQMIPADVEVFIDCLGDTESFDACRTLQSCLSTTRTVQHRLDACLLSQMSRCSPDALVDAYSYAKTQSNAEFSWNGYVKTFTAAELAGKLSHSLIHSVYMTNWQKKDSILVTVPPLQTRGLFKSDRTYLMVGAAGGLGTSICRWMVRNGARHVVVTSRNPKADPEMLNEAERYGAAVQVVPMDACSKDSVQTVVDMIRATMPPIAGVCNAAMVLRDKLFLDMNVDHMKDVLGPKMQGTEHLDSIFAQEPLDFFVLLSSSAAILNNTGQSNYHCANLYMDSLVTNRRSRGLAASIIHVGHVCDTGYVARLVDDTKVQMSLGTTRVMSVSETDVHHAFAEAVRGGQPDSRSGSHNIIMGIEPPTKPLDLTKRKPVWISDPRLGPCLPFSTLENQMMASEQAAAASAVDSLAQQVSEATTDEEAAVAALKGFATKLEGILLLPLGSIGEDSAGRPVTDLGIDSLVAVEIRTWFLKQLRVDVPVMKILGGSTVGQLSALAAKLARQDAKKRAQLEEPSGNQPVALPSPPPKDKAGGLNKNGKSPKLPEIAQVDTVVERMEPLVLEASDRGGSSTANLTTSSSVSELDDSLHESTLQSSDNNGESTPSKSSNCNSDSGSDNQAPKEIPSNGFFTQPAATARPNVLREAPMSPAQSRIWFLSKHIAEPDAYNMVFHYRVRGPLSMVRLRHALQTVTNHHECLCMCFYASADNGQPMQGLLASSAFQMTHVPGGEEQDVQRELRKLKTRVWSVESGQTLELVVLGPRPGTAAAAEEEEEEFSLLFGYHHIVMDAISFYIFLADLDKAYRMLPLDKASAGSHLDLAAHQRQQERAGAWEESLEFWRAEFETIPEMLPSLSVALPTLHRGAVGTHRVLRELAHEQGGDAAIKKMCKHLRVSPFNLHIAVLQVVIARLASIEDVCVGIVDANRSDSRASRMVGCFVNMLPVRSRILPTATLADVARAASSKALAAFAHGQVPLDSILDKVKAPRPAGSTPLFQVALNYRPAAAIASKQALGGECEMELLADDFKDAENPFEISVLVSEMSGGRIAVEVVCQKSRYTMQATEALLDAYLNVLAGFLSDSAQSVGDCVVHDQSKVEHALDLGRGAQKSFGWPRTLSERVMSICQQHSTKSAIKDGRNELSYAQLASRVNRTASAILGTGCSVGSRIAVLCNPSIDAIVAMLAILHIGGVYVPLDTSLPEARHQSLASNCTPSLIISHAATRERAHKLSAAISAPGHEPARELTLDDLSPPEETGYMAPLNAEPNAPAILLYTSGSTGTPKGVLLTQANFGNHIALKTDILGLQRGECVLQQSSLGFDMSLVQVFCALANGGCLVIVRQDVRRDPVELTTLMTQHKVSLTIATPSEYLAWLQYGSDALAQATSWKNLCMGGEPIPPLLKDELRRRLERKDLVVTNCYGPTETTAAISFQSVALDSEHGHELPGESELAQYAVGKALPNYSIRIRDSAGGAWLPVNHTGEIVIGGAGVALGYLDMPEETRARFLQTPGEEDGMMLYRTGDKGRLLSDGTLLCFGRITGDYQVKLRGLRIELGEVEAALLQASHGLIHTAVVSRRGDVLVAHCARSHESSRETTGGGEQQDATAILRRVSELLPQYSVPAAIALLPSLPTNANGKLDRKAIAALPLSPQDEAAAATSPSNNNINNNTPSGGGGEKMTVRQGELRLLWERVLPRDAATTTTNSVRITPESDFFLRGGNSLLLMKLQAAIRESMGVRVSTKALYQASTLSGMARCVAEQRSDDDEAEEDIDWAAEVAVPPSMLAQIEKLQHSSASSSSSSSSSSSAGSSSTQRPRKTSGLEILLTGATGFLGGQLLERLVQSPRVSTVHCVAVPVDEQSLLEPFLQQQADGTRRKVRCYIGNLAAPALGLTAADQTALSQTADVIVHAGSMGHCLNTYATLAAPNFASTRHLCSLALSRSPPIPLAFASSNRVALLTGSTAPPPASAAAFPPPPGAQGFTASKWASEAFLEKLAASIMTSKTKSTTTTTTTTVPWRVSIHRPCALISDRAPNSDALNAILRYSTSMRCVPSLPEHRAEGYLDFGQVDKVVEEMVGDILGLADERQQEGPAVVYRHHSGGVKVPIHEFREHMESVYGGRFESVELGQWIVRAVDAGMDPLISAYLETFLEGDASMVFPYMGEQAV